MNRFMMQPKRFFSFKRGAMSFALALFFLSFQTLLTAQVSVSITKVDPTCSGFTNASATATATGGTAPYTYRWSNNVGGSTLSGIGAGTYSVAATDALGRTGTASVDIVNPAPVAVSVNFANICNGGSVTAVASGGTGPYTYNWGSGRTGATQAGIAGGSYNLTVTDSKGCGTVKFVAVPAAFTVSLRVGTLQCFGDCDAAIDALTSGGTAPFTYRWNTGATTQAVVGLPSGTYSVTVTDANGCTGTSTGTVTNPPQIVISTTVIAPACGGGATGSATVSATGGRPPFTYKWSNNQTTATATGLNVGDHFVTVTDAGGCNRTAKVTVASNAGFTIGISSTNATCGATNGTATSSVTSGGRAPFTYKWSNGPTTPSITGIGAGIYTVTITDANGCVNTASTTVNAAGNLSVAMSGADAACGIANGTATATPTGTAPFTYKWSTNAITPTITLLGAGTYTVTVTDASGCTAIGSRTVTSGSSIGVTIDNRNVLCNGQSTGQATAMVSGGSAPYTYRWSNGGSVAVIANIGAGSYTVTVTDAAGCSGTQTVIITQPSAISITPSVTSTSCGASNGTASVTVTGGSAPYSYLWSNGTRISSISGLAAGSYTVTVTDNNSCTATATMTVTSSNGLTVSTGSTNASCFGGNNGSASVNVTGATGTITYAWSNGANTAAVTGLTAGTYTVTVSNGGCSQTSTVTITQPTEITINITLTNPTCSSNNGSLTASASGGSPQYSYKWSNGATTASISGLAAGTYTVTVTDANGCTKMTSPQITAPNGPSATISASTNVTCNGGADGSATVLATGGAAPYTYNWGSGRTSPTVTGLTAGTYTVTVTDANGCIVTIPVTITQPDAIAISGIVTNATCLSIGAIVATITGGNGGYIYKWSNNATTKDLSGIAGGNYTLTVTDSKGCTNFRLFTVSATTSPNLICTITITKQLSSQTSNDAEANVVGSLGTAPYTYKWSTGAVTQAVTGLSAGSKSVTVTDALGCTSVCSVTVPNSLCNNVTTAGTICCDQSFCFPSDIQPLTETLPASGGSATDAIQYLWMYSQTSAVFNLSSWTAITGATGKDLPLSLFPPITGKTYIIRCVRRANCADYIESNAVTISPKATANITGPLTACLNQDVTFSADDLGTGATYNWAFTGANINNSATRSQTIKFTSLGIKTVTLTATSQGCSKNLTIQVAVTSCLGIAFGNLVGFNANPLSTKEVMLDWATSNEQLPSRFLVQKSKDGITFNTIGELASQNGINNLYRFSDKEPKMGRSYYRIRQIAPDNSEVRISAAKKVLVGQNGQNVLTYPNPAQSSIFVEVLDADNLEGTVEIYNHIGALVRSQKIVSSIVRFEVNTENLPIGTYVLKIRHSDGRIESAKISKM